MGMPGFTAETSLSQTSDRYLAATSRQDASARYKPQGFSTSY